LYCVFPLNYYSLDIPIVSTDVDETKRDEERDREEQGRACVCVRACLRERERVRVCVHERAGESACGCLFKNRCR
jgi:hypothetical protein